MCRQIEGSGRLRWIKFIVKLSELRNADADGYSRVPRFENVPSTAGMQARALTVRDEATLPETSRRRELGTWFPSETPQAWQLGVPEMASVGCTCATRSCRWQGDGLQTAG